MRCFEAQTLLDLWTLSTERTTVIMNLDGNVDMVEFDTAEQSAEIVIAPQKKIPSLEYCRIFFRNEKLTPVDKYNRKSKTIEAPCNLCVSTSALNGRKITGCDSCTNFQRHIEEMHKSSKVTKNIVLILENNCYFRCF